SLEQSAGGRAWTVDGEETTYNQSIVVLVRIGLHVPDDLVSEQLRELRGFQDKALDISKRIISQRLYNLRHIEERDVNRVVLERPHGILKDEWVVVISWREERDRCDRVDRCPIEKMLFMIH